MSHAIDSLIALTVLLAVGTAIVVLGVAGLVAEVRG